MRVLRLLAGLLVLGLAACKPEYQNPNEGQPVAEDEIRLAFNRATPEQAIADARSALARQDHRLVGVFGITTLCPGAPGFGCPVDTRFVEDTGDALRDEAHMEFNNRAGAYAQAYNRIILGLAP